MNRKIAIVIMQENYMDEYGSSFFPYHLTEWTEVSEEDYQLIIRGLIMVPKDNYNSRYILVECPKQEEILNLALKQGQKQKEELFKYEMQLKEKKAKRLTKKKETEKEVFLRLKEKFEEKERSENGYPS